MSCILRRRLYHAYILNCRTFSSLCAWRGKIWWWACPAVHSNYNPESGGAKAKSKNKTNKKYAAVLIGSKCCVFFQQTSRYWWEMVQWWEGCKGRTHTDTTGWARIWYNSTWEMWRSAREETRRGSIAQMASRIPLHLTNIARHASQVSDFKAWLREFQCFPKH